MLRRRGRGQRIKKKKARKDLKVAEDELRLAREELQAVKGDLRVKVTTLDRVRHEALEAESSVECLTEELGKLRMNLERQEALASQRGEVIAELRDEACHVPDPGPTRLVNPNWFRGAKPYAGTPYLFIYLFFKAELISVV